MTWEIDCATRITWLGEWHRDHRRGDQGIPAINGDPLALPIERYVGEPANDFLHTEEFRQTLILTHELNDWWTVQVGGSSLFYEFPGSVTAASGNPIPGVFPDVPPPFFYRSRTDIVKEDEQSQSFIANLAGEFCAAGMRHRALVGMEYVYFDSDSLFNFGALPPINTADPTYLDPPTIPLGSAAFPVFRQQRVGAYVQDLVEISPQWLVLGGVRFDTVDFDFDRTLNFGFPFRIDTNQQFDRVSPRAGVVFQPFGDEDLALYFNYSRSFTPPGGGIYINPGDLKPILGEAYEVGVKTELTQWLSLNACGFHITRENADLNTSSFFLVQVGEERSQGAEVSLLGQLTERWSVVANYTYADVMLSDPLNPAFDGKRQRNVPYNTFNVWSRYNLVQTCRQTVGVALGLVHLGDRPGDLVNTFVLDEYTRWDAGFYYNRGRLYSQVYVENLFDERYAASSIDQFQVFPGAPINARAQIGMVW